MIFSAAVVQLKTLSATLSIDEKFSNSSVEKTRILQKILLYVVSVMYSFMELHSVEFDKLKCVDVSKYFRSGDYFFEASSSTANKAASEERFHWQQKSVVLVMEAGGVNWLVGKVRSHQFLLSCTYCNFIHFVYLLVLFWHSCLPSFL